MSKYKWLRWICVSGVVCAAAYGIFAPVGEFGLVPILDKELKNEEIQEVFELKEELVADDSSGISIEETKEEEEIQIVDSKIPEVTIQEEKKELKIEAEESTIELVKNSSTPSKPAKKTKKALKPKKTPPAERTSVKDGSSYYSHGTIGKTWESSLLDTANPEWWKSNEKSFKSQYEYQIQSSAFKELYKKLKNIGDDQLTGQELMKLCSDYYKLKDDAKKLHYERSDVWYYCLK